MNPIQIFQPAEDPSSYITSLYLRPFPSIGGINSLSLPRVRDTKRLLKLVGPYLRRLLIDIPLQSLYPEDDFFGVRPILHSAFMDLPALEEFCSVRDELFLASESIYPFREPPVWSFWPRLKILALYNRDVFGDTSEDDLWKGLRKLSYMETLVLTRCDGADQVDINQQWRKQFDTEEEVRPLNILLFNVEEHKPHLRGENTWNKNDKVVVKKMNMPISYDEDEDCIDLCQQWVKREFYEVAFGIT